jgi:hypothetical protein
MVIYDHWSYMTILLLEFLTLRLFDLSKYYDKYQFISLICVALDLSGTKLEVIFKHSLNLFDSSLDGKIPRLPDYTKACLFSLLRGGLS